jgi:hypothetical protein
LRVVELLAEALADDGEHSLAVEAPPSHRADQLLEDARVGEIALDRARDARVLHLDGDLAPARPGAVDLADGRARDGHVVPLLEERAERRAELFLHEGANLRHARGGRRRAELPHRRLVRSAVLLGYDPVDVARHLAHFRGEAAEGAERLGRSVCSAFSAAREKEARAAACAGCGEPREPRDASFGDPPLHGCREG